MDEGYIKYSCQWNNQNITVPDQLFIELNRTRHKLFKLGLIGMYDNGIGYGNISARLQNNQFIISGSATGNKELLALSDYAIVTGFNFSENRVFCTGKTQASSESMTHAAIYQTNQKVQAVIHVHHLHMWNHFMNRVPTSCKKITYGTPEMAMEICKLVETNSEYSNGFIVMGGHEEGVIAYANSLNHAWNVIHTRYKQIQL